VSFCKVANVVYMCDGNDLDTKKWDGSTASKMGIAAPVLAPTLSFSAGTLSPKVGYTYGYVYRNSSTGHISTMSPASANTGPLTSRTITVSYTASADAQVDKIDIYRIDDGGSVYYFLATVNNATSTYSDSIADSGLNDDVIAPLAHVNDPPPSGIRLLVWHMGRLWAASGNNLYFSAGPDCTNGVGAEAWPPANVFPVPGAITALASTSQGLIVFTSDNAYVVLGIDASSFTVPQLWQQNFGVANQNCVTQDGDLLFFFTSKGQLWQWAGTLEEVGYNIRATLGAYNPANVYLAIHKNGTDEGLFISDGSTNLWRYSVAMSCWSTVAQPVAGVRAIGSIEATTNNWQLFIGRTAGSGYLLNRDTSTYSDDGIAYSGFATVGSITVAPPHETATIEHVLLDTNAVGTYPTVSVLMNEISGTFAALPNPVGDPMPYAGTALQSSTVTMMRHDLKKATTPIAQKARHMQVKITLATEAQATKIWGLGIG
jgi:hypothetical protein